MKKFEFKNKKDKNYFEGWYFRASDESNHYAVIFAITKNEEDPHAFIMVFKDGMDKCIYKKYDSSLFEYVNNEVHIGNNILSLDKVYVNVDHITIDLEINEATSMSKSAMGYLSNAPLDCFQEVVLINGMAKGTIEGKSNSYKIYMEKTYGNKFPKKWLWIQSNHSKNDTDISFSVGYIPMMNITVPGYLLVIHSNGEFLSFHSLGGSRLKLKDNQVILTSLQYKVIIDYTLKDTIELVGPTKKAKMELAVHESLTSTASIKVYKKKQLIIEDEFTSVGLEKMFFGGN